MIHFIQNYDVMEGFALHQADEIAQDWLIRLLISKTVILTIYSKKSNFR